MSGQRPARAGKRSCDTDCRPCRRKGSGSEFARSSCGWQRLSKRQRTCTPRDESHAQCLWITSESAFWTKATMLSRWATRCIFPKHPADLLTIILKAVAWQGRQVACHLADDRNKIAWSSTVSVLPPHQASVRLAPRQFLVVGRLLVLLAQEGRRNTHPT